MNKLLEFLRELFSEFSDVIKEMIKPQTMFALMFYGTYCWLILKEKAVPESLSQIVLMILSFFYGMKVGQNYKNGTEQSQPK